MVLVAEKHLVLNRQLKQMECLLIDAYSQLHVTSSFLLSASEISLSSAGAALDL